MRSGREMAVQPAWDSDREMWLELIVEMNINGAGRFINCPWWHQNEALATQKNITYTNSSIYQIE
jgi:hypothetical protein